MVSLSSLFGGKKKQKAAGPTVATSATSNRPSSTIGTPGGTGTPATEAVQSTSSGSGKFLSVRQKSSASLGGAVSRRLSNATQLSSPPPLPTPAKNGANASRQSTTWELPKFEFDAQGKEGKLGLDNVGLPPQVSTAEWETVSGLELQVDEVKSAWSLLGPSVKGVEPKSMLQSSPDQSDTYRTLLVLLVLSIRPSLLASLPSIKSHYSSEAADSADTWKSRLLDAVGTTSPLERCEAVKWALRRMIIAKSNTTTALVDVGAYIAFVKAERSSGYSEDSYGKLFLSRTTHSAGQALQEIFDVWAALAALSGANSTLGGKICLLLGWWILGRSERSSEWSDVYEEWLKAGKRVQHLFLAWIRHQTTLQARPLPTHLLQLVEGYPFQFPGESDLPPQPPATSYTRRVLHVRLTTSTRLESIKSPIAPVLLTAAAAADVDDDQEVPLWSAWQANGYQGCHSLAAHAANGNDHAFHSNAPSRHPSQRSQIDAQPSRPTHARKRSQTHNGLPTARDSSKANAPLDSLAEEVGRLATGHPVPNGTGLYRPLSASGAPSKTKPAATLGGWDWDDFTKSGFAEDTDKIDLSLSTSPSSTAPQLPPIDITSNSPAKRTPTRKALSKSTFASSHLSANIAGEQVQDVDDVFFDFVSEAQKDGRATKSWSPFTLVRLDPPFEASSSQGVIEGLLITIEYRPPPMPEPKFSPVSESSFPPRSASPSSESTTSRFGTLNGWRRSSVIGGKGRMKSMFGSTRSIAKLEQETDVNGHRLGPSASRQPSSPGALKEEEEREVNELGQIIAPVTLGQVVKVADVDVSSSPADAGPLKNEAAENGHLTDAAEKIMPSNRDGNAGPSIDTLPSDWAYGAEGGAHAVFSYHGVLPLYSGRLLRVRKISTLRDHPSSAPSELWRDELLNRFVPSELLIKSQATTLDATWLQELLRAAEDKRPYERIEKGDGKALAEEVGDGAKVWIMENMRSAPGLEAGQKVLTVEIKPKWGFLPSSEHVYPAEAAAIKSAIGRFTLHEHYRGKSTDGYDPLDLFSGDESRLRKAVEGLCAGWKESNGQANNLRIFVDEHMILPDNAMTIPGVKDISTIPHTLSRTVLPLLSSSGLLTQLRTLQSTLDATDISDLARRFLQEHPAQAAFDETLLPDITAAELQAFTDKYVQQQACQTNGAESSEWTLRERIIAYSLSAIFKDCSIIVRAVLAPSSAGEWEVQPSSSVKLLDLDLKPLKMRHWYELDEKLWKHWRDTRAAGEGNSFESGDGTADIVSGKTEDQQVLQVESEPTDPVPQDNGLTPTPLATPKSKFIGKLNLDNASVRAMYAPSPTPSGHVDTTRSSVDTGRVSETNGTAGGIVPPTPGVELSLEDALSLPALPGTVNAAATSDPAIGLLKRSTVAIGEESDQMGPESLELDTTPLQSPVQPTQIEVPASDVDQGVPASPKLETIAETGDVKQFETTEAPEVAENQADEPSPAKASSFIEHHIVSPEHKNLGPLDVEGGNASDHVESSHLGVSPADSIHGIFERSGAPSPVPFDDARVLHSEANGILESESDEVDHDGSLERVAAGSAPDAGDADDSANTDEQSHTAGVRAEPVVLAPPSPTFGTGPVDASLVSIAGTELNGSIGDATEGNRADTGVESGVGIGNGGENVGASGEEVVGKSAGTLSDAESTAEDKAADTEKTEEES